MPHFPEPQFVATKGINFTRVNVLDPAADATARRLILEQLTMARQERILFLQRRINCKSLYIS